MLAGLFGATAAGAVLERIVVVGALVGVATGELLGGTVVAWFDEGVLRLPVGLLLLIAGAELLARAAGGVGTIEG